MNILPTAAGMRLRGSDCETLPLPQFANVTADFILLTAEYQNPDYLDGRTLPEEAQVTDTAVICSTIEVACAPFSFNRH